MTKPNWLSRLFGPREEVQGTQPRPRISLSATPSVTYVIGDIHGCLNQLLDLEEMIVDDANVFEGHKLIVTVGDYIDRGPASAQVIDHLLTSPPAGFTRICLAGNHDEMMLTFMDSPRENWNWLRYGGDATLRSYGIDSQTLLGLSDQKISAIVAEAVPSEHRTFLTSLPSLLTTPDYIVSHAGLRVGIDLEAQTDTDLMWLRDNYETDYSEFGRLVIHGHMPLDEPYVSPSRIGIDTRASASGKLTAARLIPNNPPQFFSTVAHLI